MALCFSHLASCSPLGSGFSAVLVDLSLACQVAAEGPALGSFNSVNTRTVLYEVAL